MKRMLAWVCVVAVAVLLLAQPAQAGDGTAVLDLNTAVGDQNIRTMGGVKPGQKVDVQIVLNRSYTNASAFQVVLKFDTTKVSVVAWRKDGTAFANALDLPAQVKADSVVYGASILGGTTTATGSLAVLTFQAANSYAGDTEITLKSLQIRVSGVSNTLTPGASVTLSSTGTVVKVTPDFDGDEEVGFSDFFLFAAAFGQKATGENTKFDLDGDGEIGFGDFFAFAESFGKKIIKAPTFALSTSSVTFDSTAAGSKAQKALIVTNTGDASLSVTGIIVGGADASQFTVSPTTATIAAGGSQTIIITFAPTSSGTKSASLSIAHNAAGSPSTVALKGTGSSVRAIRLSLTSLTLDGTAAGSTAQKALIITNTGDASLSVTGITISGTDASQFTVSPTTATITAGGSQTITVTFAPTSSGDKSALLSIVHNTAGSPSTVALKGVGNTGGGIASQIFSLPGGATMDFVYIQPGKFLMGSPSTEEGRESDEGPQHEVTITKGFYLGQVEMTQGQWQKVMGTTPWLEQPYVQVNVDNPAVYLSWEDGQALVKKLNDAESGAGYRLPTEAEWEYACRAGTTTAWSFGDDESKLKDYAWYGDNTRGVGEQYAHKVGTKLPNPWGLFDMHGNVFEWGQDWSGPYSSSAQTDPPGSVSGSYRVVRGGSFRQTARVVRSAYRQGLTPSYRGFDSYSFGLRLLRQGGPSTGGTTHAISGLVTESGKGLLQVTVTLSGGSTSKSATTLSDGSYSFSGLPDGTYTVTASLSGYTFSGPVSVTLAGSDKAATTIMGTKTVTPPATVQQIVVAPGDTMVLVPAGEFTMGPDPNDSINQKSFQVTLSAFYIDKYEVTNAQYQAFVKATSRAQPDFATDSMYNGSSQPVVGVSWFDAQAYCEWSKKRLPTEAEWEKAARGTDARTYPWGNDAPKNTGPLGLVGDPRLNYNTNVGRTTNVGSYPKGASPYGAQDMAGNVWEWVSSKLKVYPYSATDGRESIDNTSDNRVLRGGSWDDGPLFVRAAVQNWGPPTARGANIGFRCSRTQ